MQKEINGPLTFNVHVIDNDTDKEESVRRFEFRKPPSRNADVLSAKEKREIAAVDKKTQSLMKLIVWAMNNSKTLEVVAANEDD